MKNDELVKLKKQKRKEARLFVENMRFLKKSIESNLKLQEKFIRAQDNVFMDEREVFEIGEW